MSKLKDFMTPERWKYLKALRPSGGRLTWDSHTLGPRVRGRNAYKRAKKIYDASIGAAK